MRGILFVAAIVASFSAHAGESQYDCQVIEKHVVRDGRLEQVRIERTPPFTVFRQTGEISGPAYALKDGLDGWKVETLDRGFGPADQSYKLRGVSRIGPYVKTLYLEIRESEPGERKPFMLYRDFAVDTGVCR